ncbi:MAG: uracil-DNA glycosylase [Candidatus Peregrinibacteria bacterium]|nr:uracil-DNA glycosylase [Candidatus Peregrinibacteria bacterium]
MADVKIHPSWKKVVGEEFDKEYFKKLTQFVKNEYSTKTTYPEGKNIFRAFELCPFEEVKVVIIGQDPYHGPKQANGLCFSVNDKIPLPPSLQNIYKEIETDLVVKRPTKGNLDNWARQGVLLLNATLTVRANTPGSHQKQGWEQFTDAVIKAISDKKENIVFLLWGKYAQDKGVIIDRKKHQVLSAPHPSPFSAHSGFFGCKHFSKTNKYLESIGEKVINWTML